MGCWCIYGLYIRCVGFCVGAVSLGSSSPLCPVLADDYFCLTASFHEVLSRGSSSHVQAVYEVSFLE